MRIKDHGDHGDFIVGIERLENDMLYVWDEKAGVLLDPKDGKIIQKEWKESTLVDHEREPTGSSRALSDLEGEALAKVVFEYGHKDAAVMNAKDLAFIANLI